MTISPTLLNGDSVQADVSMVTMESYIVSSKASFVSIESILAGDSGKQSAVTVDCQYEMDIPISRSEEHTSELQSH